MSKIHITTENFNHLVARQALIKSCFADPQPERAAYQLRKGVAAIAKYSIVALDRKKLVGSLRFTPMQLPDGSEVLMLGPLAIAPLMRGQGIGQSLVKNGLNLLQQDKHKGVIVIGDAGYFSALGFEVSLTQNIQLSGVVAPLTLLGYEWQEGFLSGQNGFVRRLNT